jgi:hypothetical protein
MQTLLSDHPGLQGLLFRRGYLLTNDSGLDLSRYPFHGHWTTTDLGPVEGRAIALTHHNQQTLHVAEAAGTTIALIGHAYNPFSMEAEEPAILRQLLEAWHDNEDAFWDAVSGLTGVHLIVVREENRLVAVQDCAGLQSCYFGNVGEDVYLTSHPQMVADLRGLAQDPFVSRLIASRAYGIGNRHLPGNSSPFAELKRLGGNTFTDFTSGQFRVRRFFPDQPRVEAASQQEIRSVVSEFANLLNRNLELISRKWERPAISLTGGTDSKTTLACASGLYDKFSYFSFHAKPQELVDANAAHGICEALSLKHKIHAIPDANVEVPDFDVLKAIIDHNTSYYVQLADHEIRKLIYLMRLGDFDVEVKSWASEITRVFLERKYDIRMPQKLTPRHFSIFQTRYFGDPALLAESDRRYAGFMREVGLAEGLGGYEHADLFYWEVRMGAWGASVVSAFDFAHTVTIPFNNRKLVTLFLTLPREMRKSDAAHRAVMDAAEPRIPALEVEIPNLYFHRHRVWLEKAYYLYRTLPASVRTVIAGRRRRPPETKP